MIAVLYMTTDVINGRVYGIILPDRAAVLDLLSALPEAHDAAFLPRDNLDNDVLIHFSSNAYDLSVHRDDTYVMNRAICEIILADDLKRAIARARPGKRFTVKVSAEI